MELKTWRHGIGQHQQHDTRYKLDVNSSVLKGYAVIRHEKRQKDGDMADFQSRNMSMVIYDNDIV